MEQSPSPVSMATQRVPEAHSIKSVDNNNTVSQDSQDSLLQNSHANHANPPSCEHSAMLQQSPVTASN